MRSKYHSKEFPVDHHRESGGGLSGSGSCEKYWKWWEFRRVSTAWDTKVVNSTVTFFFFFFFVALTEMAVTMIALRQEEHSQDTGSWGWLYSPLCVVVLVFLGEYPKGIPFHLQKRNGESVNWNVYGQIDSSAPSSSFFCSSNLENCNLVLSIKLELDFYCWIEHRGLAIREKFRIQFQQ